MLAFKMLIYALVNSAFSGIASLKLHLFIQPPNKTWMTNLLFSHPLVLSRGAILFSINLQVR